jgi:hypothetical protein
VVLRSNHSQTVDLSFKAQPRNLCSSSPRAQCKPHMAPPDLSIARPPSTRPVQPSPVLCTKYPTPATILVVVRHVAPATYTPRDKQTRFSNKTKVAFGFASRPRFGVETRKVRQMVQFFSASTKRSFVGSLIFAPKCKNRKGGKNRDFSGHRFY